MDYKLTKGIYTLINNSKFKELPYYAGLIPYELYILPGMYLAILQIVWLGTPNPLQFHLLPHWFAYSIFQFLKKAISKKRPGCEFEDMSEFINSSHCESGHDLQSFPSGHTGIAFSLATSLFMEMMYSDNPKFFEIPIKNKKIQILISFIGLFVAFMISLHRISKGFHSVFDVLIGMILGMSIGFISWTLLETYKKMYNNICETHIYDKNCDNHKSNKNNNEMSYWLKNWKLFDNKLFNNSFINNSTGLARIIITIPIIFLIIKFFTKDIYKLTAIKH
jgi:membrane-associated phospholipid phosphatase